MLISGKSFLIFCTKFLKIDIGIFLKIAKASVFLKTKINN